LPKRQILKGDGPVPGALQADGSVEPGSIDAWAVRRDRLGGLIHDILVRRDQCSEPFSLSYRQQGAAMKQRWALVMIGAWLMGSICTSVVATENFYTVDHLLASPSNAMFTAMVQKLGQPAARELLRYLSSELNRLYFQMWNVAQIGIGVLVFWLLAGFREHGPARAGVVAMLAIVVLMLAYLTPAIVSLGRALDFVPRDPSPPGMSRFWVLHAAYTSLEMIKLLVGAVVAFWIARSSTRSA
jgi:hypothetical protein